MRKSIFTLAVVSVVLGAAGVAAEAAPRGPAAFYDSRGGFRGYAWCLKDSWAVFDCNYFTRVQCDMSASGRRAYCTPNPFALDQGYNPYAAELAPKKRVIRRQVY